jgi:murein tripeptide amidase MpaA
MKNTQHSAFLLILISLTLFYGNDTRAQNYQRIAFEANPNQLLELQKVGIPLDHLSRQGNEIILDLSIREVAILKSIVPNARIEIGDLTNYYAKRNANPTSNFAVANTPKNFKLGSLGGFLNYNEMQAALDSMHALYPNIISAKSSIGQTVEGREIWVVKISDGVLQDDTTEAEILYDAMHHAREPQAMMQLFYFMWHLLESYDKGDARAQYIVNNRQLYFIPIVNPDGYVHNQTIAPTGGGMWRKNRKVNGDGTFGVDLNRNYAQDWGYDDFGSSPDPSSNVFRGASPFSEPETQAMRNFVNARRFKSNLSYHSYGEYLIYPFGAKENYYTADSFLFESYADSLTAINQYFSGTVFETLNYYANGGSCDWMYAAQTEHSKIMSFTPEVGGQFDGFWPLSSRIIPIAEENLEANLFLAERCIREIRRGVPKRTLTRGTQGTITVKYLSDGYQSDVSFVASLEFPVGNSKFSTSNDSLKLNFLQSFDSRTKQFEFTANVTSIDSSIARIKTELDGKVYYDTIMVVFDPNSVGVEKIVSSDFKVYPNPNNGNMRILLAEDEFVKIEIISATGAIVYSNENLSSVVDITSNLPAGVYNLQATQQNQSSVNKKVVICP